MKPEKFKIDFPGGLIETQFPLSPPMLSALDSENWVQLDQLFKSACQEGGSLRQFLGQYLDFSHLEHIIAIRSAPEDEDGIWHDDGSRILGFSLSLTRNSAQVQGGVLQFRPFGSPEMQSFTTRPIGTILLFLTGTSGFEHRVTAVTSGRRIVIAGWCQ